MKVTTSDALAILRRFNRADERNLPREIDQLRSSRPTEGTLLVSLRFEKRRYYLIFNATIEDDINYILELVRTDNQATQGSAVENPNDALSTYALPFKGKEVYLFEVLSDKKRLDVVLTERFPEHSRSTWQKYIKNGHVSVNGTVQTSPKQDVTDTDTIAVTLPQATDFSDHSFPILYIDNDVIVINKPVGALTHAKGALNDEFTVADFFRRYTTYNLDTNRPGIVHRLDRDTSGILIGARHEAAAQLLQKQFADRRAKKTYIAITSGLLKQKQATLELPIGRNPAAPSTFKVDAKGKSATTTYKVIDESNGKSLIELQPKTGRTHQLRVHMAYLNAPIYGDRVYGKEAERLYLHAWRLEVTISGGERRVFEAAIPKEFFSYFPGAVVS